MSSLFRTAALTILSKTLQTVLSKYLEDVDVEGVALPSFLSSSSTDSVPSLKRKHHNKSSGTDGNTTSTDSSSADAGSSPSSDPGGWGVRLSNVKLRSGVELMKLPGKPHSSRKKQQKPNKKPNRTRAKAKSLNQRNGRKGMKRPRDKMNVQNDNTDPSSSSLPSSKQTESLTNDATTTVATTNCVEKTNKLDLEDSINPLIPAKESVEPDDSVAKSQQSSSSSSSWILSGWYSKKPPTPEKQATTLKTDLTPFPGASEQNEQRQVSDPIPTSQQELLQPNELQALEEEQAPQTATESSSEVSISSPQKVEEEGDSKHTKESTLEDSPPPVKKSSSWLSGWYKTTSTSSVQDQPTSDKPAPPAAETAPCDQESKENMGQTNVGLSEDRHSSDQTIDSRQKDVVVSTNDKDNDEVDHDSGNMSISDDELDKDDDDSLGSDKDCDIGSESDHCAEDHDTNDPYSNSPPVVLRFGDNGCIGTLDVRLVGRRELHVLIEDADLTVEATVLVPRNKNQQRQTADSGEDKKNPKMDSTAPNPSTADSGSKATNSKKAKIKPPPETVSERILAENFLARLVSWLPNLLLRDIRLRLIVREEYLEESDLPSGEDKSTTPGLPVKGSTEAASLTDMGTLTTNESTSSCDATYNTSFPLSPPMTVELSIELLSITDGQDFFAHFRTNDEAARAHDDDDDESVSSSSSGSSSTDDEDDETRAAAEASFLPGTIVNSTTDAPIVPRNNYMTKRIRTGRGSEGGIVLRVVPNYDEFGDWTTTTNIATSSESELWPRQRWNSVVDKYCVMRCSGVDIQARIFLGNGQDGTGDSSSRTTTTGASSLSSSSSSSITTASSSNILLDDYSVDSLLLAGVDYIVPGPQPPPVVLPPIVEDEEDEETTGKPPPTPTLVDKLDPKNLPPLRSSPQSASQEELPTPSTQQPPVVLWELPGATTYQLDSNGIQSSWVDTSFHRVARGLFPTTHCSTRDKYDKLLPCEYCQESWEDPLQPQDDNHIPKRTYKRRQKGAQKDRSSASKQLNIMDSAAPLGGLVLHVSIRDKLEINLDRPSLESIGTVLDLFIKKKSEQPTNASREMNDKQTSPDTDMAGYTNTIHSSEQKIQKKSDKSVQEDLKVPNHSTKSANPAASRVDETQQSALDANDEDDKNQFNSTTKTNTTKSQKKTKPRMDAFPRYMQPEKIQYLGLYVAEIKVRLHLIPVPSTMPSYLRRGSPKFRYSFSYWEANLRCLTADLHLLAGPKKFGDDDPSAQKKHNVVEETGNCFENPDEVARSFEDIRLDIGHITVTEFCGLQPTTAAKPSPGRRRHSPVADNTVGTVLVSLGVQHPPRRNTADMLDDDVTVESMMTREDDCQRPPWPSTAAVLLDISPPLESLIYENRERHGLQLRYVAVRLPLPDSRIKATSSSIGNDATASPDSFQQAMLHVKLGTSAVNIPSQIGSIVKTVIQQTKESLFPLPIKKHEVPASQSSREKQQHDGTAPQAKEKSKKNNGSESILRYMVDLEAGSVHVHPMVKVGLPSSTIMGELSSTSGFAIETVLDHLEVQYQQPKRAKQQQQGPPSSLQFIHQANKRHSLSLTTLASLPEALRLHIFFFLTDLNPLAQALGVKSKKKSTTSSPFLMHKAINKQIDKLALSLQQGQVHNLRRAKLPRVARRKEENEHKADAVLQSPSTETLYSDGVLQSASIDSLMTPTAKGNEVASTPLPEHRNINEKGTVPRSNSSGESALAPPQDGLPFRRQSILTELLKLSDQELEGLWATHVLKQQQQQIS